MRPIPHGDGDEPTREADSLALDTALAAVRQGEVDAYAGVVRHFQRRLLGYLARRAPDLAQVEDLAQDVFVAAYQSLSRFEVGRDFGAWLFGIAAHRLGRAWRDHGAERRGLAGLGAAAREELARWSEAPAAVGRDDREHDALDGCLDDLPTAWRELVSWHYSEGLTLLRIAERRGSASSTVGVLLHRARRRLRACIEGRLAAEAGR